MLVIGTALNFNDWFEEFYNGIGLSLCERFWDLKGCQF